MPKLDLYSMPHASDLLVANANTLIDLADTGQGVIGSDKTGDFHLLTYVLLLTLAITLASLSS